MARDGTCMSESWSAYKWVMVHVQVSHDTCMSKSWHAYEWVMLHVQVSHSECISESKSCLYG